MIVETVELVVGALLVGVLGWVTVGAWRGWRRRPPQVAHIESKRSRT